MSARWDAALRHAVRAFGIAPAAFWRLSLREWRALTAEAVAPLRADEMRALMAAWPDERDAGERRDVSSPACGGGG